MTTDTEVRPATPTERAIAAMLVENTGAHMLDSGIYGRAWQVTRAAYGLDGGLPNSSFHGGPSHNPDEPRKDEIERVALAMCDGPEGTIDSFGTVYIDTFHWLANRLDYEPNLDRKFRRYVDKLWAASQDARSWPYCGEPRIEWPYETGAIERFMEKLREHGASVEEVGSRNTYNGEDSLDRTLQYTAFTVENPIEWAGGIRRFGPHSTIQSEYLPRLTEFLPDGTYVALQVHGGADVRGGYTDAHLFTLHGDFGDLYDNDRIEVWCEGASLVLDDQAPGQIRIDDSEPLEPEEVRHFWDNSYGDGFLRRYDQKVGDQVDEILTLPYREEERVELLKEGTIDTSYDPKRPRLFKANVGMYDEDAKCWRCPFDGSELRASGAVVG